MIKVVRNGMYLNPRTTQKKKRNHQPCLWGNHPFLSRNCEGSGRGDYPWIRISQGLVLNKAELRGQEGIAPPPPPHSSSWEFMTLGANRKSKFHQGGSRWHNCCGGMGEFVTFTYFHRTAGSSCQEKVQHRCLTLPYVEKV